MHKIKYLILTLLVFCSSSLYGEQNKKVVQIIADSIEQNGNIITANNNVLLFSPNYYITADKVVFDRNKSTVELFNNVSILKNNDKKVISNYAFLDLDKEIDSLSPILLIDKVSNIWINAKHVDVNKDYHNIHDATLSSCDCTNPEWSIGFSSGDFNKSEEWINTYNNTVYIGSIPAWYFLIPAIPYVATPNLLLTLLAVKSPYFGFPTSNKRRSGLLIPQFGYTKKEGWFYMQPIYYAPYDNLDFEYIPQFRQKRGKGHELNFRLADSRDSKLTLSGGVFYESDTYFQENDLSNKYHKGWQGTYERTKLFSNTHSTDGLYLKAQNMNDVDFVTVSYDFNDATTTTTINKLLKSELKYYYDTQKYNFNIGFDKYNDISLDNNDEVMQVLPSTNFHIFTQNIFLKHLQISNDMTHVNKTRISGLSAKTFDMDIPISYSNFLFNNYLSYGIEKKFTFNSIQYNNSDTNNTSYENGTYLKSYDKVYIETDLLKVYNSIIHTIGFNITYLREITHKIKGDYYGLNSDESDLSIFPYVNLDDSVDFLLNETFFDKTSKTPYVTHKLTQKISFDNNGSSTLNNLENQLTVQLPYTTLSNKFIYNHADDMIINSSYAVKVKKGTSYLNLDYSKSIDKNTTTDSYKNGDQHQSIVASIGTKVLKYYTIRYKEQYNITDHISTIKEYGVTIDKKCWAVDLKLVDSLIATSSGNSNAIRQNIIYATYTLKPITSMQQKYVQKEREE